MTIVPGEFLRRLGQPTLGSALCYVPAARVEVNCQTCNYSQVRLSGLSGAYTQLLINGRPIVSPLVTLYGLDQFPTAMLDRIEVLRGAGSVLYGSSAIAGVVNLITRDRWTSSASVNTSLSVIGGSALETRSSAMLLLGNDDEHAPSFAILAHRRTRDGYDANGDGFTELAQLRSTGVSLDLRAGDSIGAFHFNVTLLGEERRGGNQLDRPPDRAEQAEYRNHEIVFVNSDYRAWLGNHSLDVYAALSTTTRVHYTGVDYADGWGKTRSTTGVIGVQDVLTIGDRFLHQMHIGAEYQFERTTDAIEAYGYAIDQHIRQAGIFTQANVTLWSGCTALVGVRAAWHNALRGAVFLSRLGVLWSVSSALDLRLNYGEGFRAPQAFETDMHIAFASGGVSVIRIDPGLQHERARSITASVTHRGEKGTMFWEASLDAFASWLHAPFVLGDAGIDSNGNRILLRANGGDANVSGLTAEIYAQWNLFELTATATVQRSWYAGPVQWSSHLPAERRFLRTPDLYGSMTLRWRFSTRWEAMITGILTGSMLVPHMSPAGDRLVHTPPMFDGSVTLRWRIAEERSAIGSITVGLTCGNVFNAYQQDFDRGRYRDSNYIWGPPQPRTVGIELRWMR
jgi:outer membrane receptor for ferrienterochelin and colicins